MCECSLSFTMVSPFLVNVAFFAGMLRTRVGRDRGTSICRWPVAPVCVALGLCGAEVVLFRPSNDIEYAVAKAKLFLAHRGGREMSGPS